VHQVRTVTAYPAAPAVSSIAGNPVHGTPRPGARPGFWVVPHAAVCPECGSCEVSQDEVDTGDGIEETAYVCESCGCAWPLACVFEWGR
jgi:hypothetical protein